MKDLLASVQKAEQEEYERAKQKFGPVNASSHESFGILKEEYEEAIDEVNLVRNYLSDYWTHVKKNDPVAQRQSLEDLQRFSQYLACEAIQVAAMAYKALLTLDQVKE